MLEYKLEENNEEARKIEREILERDYVSYRSWKELFDWKEKLFKVRLTLF